MKMRLVVAAAVAFIAFCVVRTQSIGGRTINLAVFGDDHAIGLACARAGDESALHILEHLGGWPLKRIDAILRAVLRAGSYELEHRKDVPGRVVVSEYVDVAHAFVEKDETGMVNAVLDQIARQFRADEFARG
jgi:hypothetical protein